MIEWFKNLSDTEKIAIIVPIGLAICGVIGGLLKWLFGNKAAEKTATPLPIDANLLDRHENALKQLGQSELTNKNQREIIRQLEEQLAQSQITADSSQRQTPQPSQEAKYLATHIEDDAGPYVRALMAIAQGDETKADKLLDESQQFLNKIQQQKDLAQVKIYIAHMQNMIYAGKPRDALQYCNLLKPLAGNDSYVLNEMAVVYLDNADYQNAEPLMKCALEIDESSFGKDHPNVATDLNNLALLYKATNRLTEAEPLMKRAITIGESSFGKDHPDVATRLNNLAALYLATNRLTEAEPLMKRALSIDESSLGKDHPNVARDLNNLAQLYKDTNRLDNAEPLMERALVIAESSFGKDHPNVATALNNLSLLYLATNRLAKAESLMKRAVEIDESSLGNDHPNLANRLNCLAGLYQATDRLDEAEPLIKHALAINESSFGKDHPNVANNLNNMATLYQDTDRLGKAEPLMKRAVEILINSTRKTGHRHPHLMDTVNRYAVLLFDMGDSKEQAIAKVIAMAPDLLGQ